MDFRLGWIGSCAFGVPAKRGFFVGDHSEDRFLRPETLEQRGESAPEDAIAAISSYRSISNALEITLSTLTESHLSLVAWLWIRTETGSLRSR